MSKARDLAGLFNLGSRSGTTAQRPATADVGEIYYNGTTGKTQIYTPTGWQDMASGIPYGNTAARPTNVTGQPYFNGELGRLEMYTTAAGWQNIIQEVPGVGSITGNYSEATNSGAITISGTNFAPGSIASAIGTNGVEVQAASTTYNSIVQLTANFINLSNANEPYDIKVTNPSNLFGMIPDALYVNATPVWQTASGSLGTFTEQVSISVSATATDSDSSTITYALASGSTLPSGVSLNSSTGVISGTLPNVTTDTTYSFTINATDGLNVIPRTFSITSQYLIDIEYLLVGGGGSGGWDVGGGGGAGGLLIGSKTLQRSSTFALSIGGGGAAIPNSSTRNSGGDTTAFGLTAFGGGAGGNWNNGGAASNGLSGGSGGGGGGWSQIGYGGSGTNGQGFAGGNATSNTAPSYGGGGGGAGGVGSNGTTGDGSQIAGGPGVASSITGTSIVYAAGGKGGGDNTPNANTSDGTNGLGNGADGDGQGQTRRGGSGAVIIAYPNTFPAITTIPGTLTYDQPTRSGYRVYRFTAGSGTVTA